MAWMKPFEFEEHILCNSPKTIYSWSKLNHIAQPKQQRTPTFTYMAQMVHFIGVYLLTLILISDITVPLKNRLKNWWKEFVQNFGEKRTSAELHLIFHQTLKFSQPSQVLMALFVYHVCMQEVGNIWRNGSTFQVGIECLLQFLRKTTAEEYMAMIIIKLQKPQNTAV